MRGDDGEVDIEPVAKSKTFADGSPVTDSDREAVRKLLLFTGWQVLLKLLDAELQSQEDAAKELTLADPLSDEIKRIWIEVAANRRAREWIVATAEKEAAKAEEKKARKKK